MKKLKLDPEELVVEAFEASEDTTGDGSVEAYEAFTTYGPWLCMYVCDYTQHPCEPETIAVC